MRRLLIDRVIYYVVSEVKPYMVNERLFPEPIQRSLWADYDNQEPHLRQEEREGTYEEPRFVRYRTPDSVRI